MSVDGGSAIGRVVNGAQARIALEILGAGVIRLWVVVGVWVVELQWWLGAGSMLDGRKAVLARVVTEPSCLLLRGGRVLVWVVELLGNVLDRREAVLARMMPEAASLLLLMGVGEAVLALMRGRRVNRDGGSLLLSVREAVVSSMRALRRRVDGTNGHNTSTVTVL